VRLCKPILELVEIIHQEDLIMDHTNKTKYKENRNFLLGKSHSKKECMKTIKFTTKSKSKEENNRKEDGKRNNNKNDMNNKIKEVIKNQTLHLTKINKFGRKSSQNTNPNQGLWLKKLLQVTLFIRSHKIQVKSEPINKEIMKNPGGKMQKIKIKRKKAARNKIKKRHF